jgi:hypothetical protein
MWTVDWFQYYWCGQLIGSSTTDVDSWLVPVLLMWTVDWFQYYWCGQLTGSSTTDVDSWLVPVLLMRTVDWFHYTLTQTIGWVQHLLLSPRTKSFKSWDLLHWSKNSLPFAERDGSLPKNTVFRDMTPCSLVDRHLPGYSRVASLHRSQVWNTINGKADWLAGTTRNNSLDLGTCSWILGFKRLLRHPYPLRKGINIHCLAG